MAWIRALVYAEIDSDGFIKIETTMKDQIQGPRPKTVRDVGSADPTILGKILDRTPGNYTTWCWLGGATAICAPWDGLLTLPEDQIEKLVTKYGSAWENDVFLGEVRNTGAPHLWNVAEPSGGMAEDADLPRQAMLETVEMGFYKPDGWAAFDVSALDQLDYTPDVLAEQQQWWALASQQLEQKYWLNLEPITIGRDSLDGRNGIVVVRPEGGDLALLVGARAALEPGANWLLRDLEAHQGPDGWRLLNRKIVAIALRHDDRSPLMFEFAPDGGLDECGLHVALSGEALENNISQLFRGLLGPHGLCWID